MRDRLIINFSSAHQFRCDFNFTAGTDSYGPIARLTISERDYGRRDTQTGPQYVREYIFAVVELQEDPPRRDSIAIRGRAATASWGETSTQGAQAAEQQQQHRGRGHRRRNRRRRGQQTQSSEDRKSTRLNSSHSGESRMPSSA